jgi:hypothetical protein
MTSSSAVKLAVATLPVVGSIHGIDPDILTETSFPNKFEAGCHAVWSHNGRTTSPSHIGSLDSGDLFRDAIFDTACSSRAYHVHGCAWWCECAYEQILQMYPVREA